MAKLKCLDIVFSKRDDFLKEVDEMLLNKSSAIKSSKVTFDSVETVHKVLSQNRLAILKTISRLKPVSINQLSKQLAREQPHVQKDCRYLEEIGLIKLVKAPGLKKQYAPKLAVDFDIIRIKSNPEDCFPISEAAVKTILKSA